MPLCFLHPTAWLSSLLPLKNTLHVASRKMTILWAIRSLTSCRSLRSSMKSTTSPRYMIVDGNLRMTLETITSFMNHGGVTIIGRQGMRICKINIGVNTFESLACCIFSTGAPFTRVQGSSQLLRQPGALIVTVDFNKIASNQIYKQTYSG